MLLEGAVYVQGPLRGVRRLLASETSSLSIPSSLPIRAEGGRTERDQPAGDLSQASTAWLVTLTTCCPLLPQFLHL